MMTISEMAQGVFVKQHPFSGAMKGHSVKVKFIVFDPRNRQAGKYTGRQTDR